MEQELQQLQYPTSPIPYHHQVPHLAYQQHHLLPELLQPLPWPDYLLSLYPVVGGNYSPDLFSFAGLDPGDDQWGDQSQPLDLSIKSSQKSNKVENHQEWLGNNQTLSPHTKNRLEDCMCPFCGKIFSRPWLLKGHVRTHTGEKPFACSQCKKPFADKSNLKAHEQTHSDLKPYRCTNCGKKFALKSYLAKHEEAICTERAKSC